MSVFSGGFGVHFIRPGGRGKGRSHAWVEQEKRRAGEKLAKQREEIEKLDQAAQVAFGKPGGPAQVKLRKAGQNG